MNNIFIGAIENHLEAKISFANGSKKMLCRIGAKINSEGHIYAANGFSIMEYIDQYQNSIGNWERTKNKPLVWIENKNPKLEAKELIQYGFENNCQKSTTSLPGFKNYANPKLDEAYFLLSSMVESNENKNDKFVFETKVYLTNKGFLFDKYTNVFGVDVINNKPEWNGIPFAQIPNFELENIFSNKFINELFEQKLQSSFSQAIQLKNELNQNLDKNEQTNNGRKR